MAGAGLMLGVFVFVGCAPAAKDSATVAVPESAQSSLLSQRQSAEPVERSAAAEPDCGLANVTKQHQAPELEALVPASIAGRRLATWSLQGRCWYRSETGLSNAEIDSLVAQGQSPGASPSIDWNHFTYAVGGRTNTKADPPYFVFAAGRSDDDAEIDLALYLLFSGAGFHDLRNPGIVGGYATRTVGGKSILVGSPDMLDQNEHQRGRPYLYQTEDAMFLIVTDDDAWAADAVRQLP